MNNWENQWVDYYKVLEVDRNANAKQIKKHYHKLMHKYHPDVYTGEDGMEKAQLINEAYTVLSNPEKKKQYDLEYDRRLASEPQTDNINSESAEENMRNYTEEEQRYAKKMAVRVIAEKELEKANIVIDAKNEIIYSAYEDNIDTYTYYKSVKEFVTMANEYIKGLYDLCELCYKYELFSEIETINEVIIFLEENIKNIPLSPSDAIRFMKAESKKENLITMGTKVKSEIEESIQDIETLFHCVYQKKISHIEFNQFSESVLVKASDVISSSREFVMLLSKNNLENPELETVLGKLEALIKAWPEDYEAASQIGKCIDTKNSLKDVLNQYEEYVRKIEKIIKIIKRYPVNHRVEVLYNYSQKLSQDILNELKQALDYNGLDKCTQEIIDKAYSFSSEAREIYTAASEQIKQADEIYSTSETHVYNNKEIEILLKQAVNQFDKGKSLELLKEAGYHLHTLEEINVLFGNWTQLSQILNSNINMVCQYNATIETMMKTIQDIIQNYKSVMNFDVSQLENKKENKFLKWLSITGINALVLFAFDHLELLLPESLIIGVIVALSSILTDNPMEIYQMNKEMYCQKYLDLKEGRIL